MQQDIEQEESTEVDPKFLKGFNDGYLIAKHEPALAAQLAASPNQHNIYFDGLLNGQKEYDKEVLEWSKSFSKGKPAKDDRGIDKER